MIQGYLNSPELKKAGIPKELLQARQRRIQQTMGALQSLQTFQQGLKTGKMTPMQALEQSVGTPAFPEMQALVASEDPQAVAGIKARADVTSTALTQEGETARQKMKDTTDIQKQRISTAGQIEGHKIEAGAHVAVANINARSRKNAVDAAGEWAMKRTKLAGDIAMGKLNQKSVATFNKGLAAQLSKHTGILTKNATTLMPKLNAAMANTTNPMSMDEVQNEVNTANSQLAQIAAVDPAIVGSTDINSAATGVSSMMQTQLSSIMVLDPDSGKVVPASKFFTSQGALRNGVSAAQQAAVIQQMKTIKASIMGHLFDPVTGQPIGELGLNKQMWQSINTVPAFNPGDDSLSGAAATSPDEAEPNFSSDSGNAEVQ